MILVILFIGLVVFICGLLFAKGLKKQLLIGGIGLIVLVGSAILMIGNDNWHWGMKKVTESQTISVKTDQKGVNILLYKQIGNNEKVYVYKNNRSTKLNKTKVNLHVTNTVKKVNSTSQLIQKNQYWKYKNNFYSLLFHTSGDKKIFIRQNNTFEIGKDWMVLTTKQAKTIQKKLNNASFKKQLESQGNTYVTKVVTEAVEANPAMSTSERTVIQKQATKAFKVYVEKKLLASLK